MSGRRIGDPLVPPLVASSTFFVPGDPAAAPFAYGRNANPTWVALEEAYGAIAGAPSIACSSGMGASATVIDALLPRGGRIVAPSDAYYTLRTFIQARGFDAKLVPSNDPLAFARAAEGAKLVWVETPTNPGLDIVDLRATAEAAKRAGAIFVVDNTLATAAGQDPFAFGADVVVVSATKATSGHSDAVIGLVSAKDPKHVEQIRTARTIGGAIPGVLEAWLCLRGLKTLELRLERASQTAEAIASVLERRVPTRHPGLTSHPAHALARSQMKHFGPVLTFDLGTEARAVRFLANVERAVEATSFGGVESTLERRARWGGDAVSPGLIRMSVGIETPGKILEDLVRALDAAG
jgi:cystathionine gamma-lyase